MSEDCVTSIAKTLSANDVGETGGHQAGILVPKTTGVLPFFPVLDGSQKNPRVSITFEDHHGDSWHFAFIYYNNQYFGGTRNEYRLTGMTPFFARHNLHSGDELILRRERVAGYTISYERQNRSETPHKGRLRLGSSWKVITL